MKRRAIGHRTVRVWVPKSPSWKCFLFLLGVINYCESREYGCGLKLIAGSAYAHVRVGKLAL